eukprot:TRINITY_DN8026_c0_g1_i13.p2 TRINITY_DN8026_c0_g1~~TRINITY_DN8026_c0_g1_i13.p2  ORF type:complete len:164 (-),score=17.74 TRINITY_DN8026_c0_g1_i13:153-644(-)
MRSPDIYNATLISHNNIIILMQTRQSARIKEIPSAVWCLKLALPKDQIAEDLNSLAALSTSSSKNHKTPADTLPLRVEEAEKKQYNGRVTRGKRQIAEVALLPVKRRLTSEADNLAVDNLCKFCRDMWSECWFPLFLNSHRHCQMQWRGGEGRKYKKRGETRR